MNYKEVFQLAQEKGYKVDVDSLFLVHHSTEDGDTKLLLKLTLIQKWLRDEHEIIVVPNTFDKGWLEAGKWCYQFSIADKTDSDEDRWISAKEYPTWEEALLEGITGALKLLP